MAEKQEKQDKPEKKPEAQPSKPQRPVPQRQNDPLLNDIIQKMEKPSKETGHK